MFQSFQAPAYAGFWIRVAANLIDSVIMMAVFCPLGVILVVVSAATGADENSAPAALANLSLNLASTVVEWLYCSLLESSSWQGTVGKKPLGLKVTDLNGNRIGLGKATGRHFGKILSSLICFVGLIMVAFTEKKQGLHDILAGTLVVKGPLTGAAFATPPPPPDFSYGGTFGGGLR
jgi:uncharacterized RDD family membrane protein YckC